MLINNVSPSFKAYIPVNYFARYPETEKYYRVTKNKNIKKCQSFVIRNLNGTAKKKRNDEFVGMYSSYDGDYSKHNIAKSVYDKTSPTVYLVTGARDVDALDIMAKPIGRAKGDSIDSVGHTKTFEAQSAARDYFKQVSKYLKQYSKRVKNSDNKPATLNVYYTAKYNKKNELVDFIYDKSEIV